MTDEPTKQSDENKVNKISLAVKNAYLYLMMNFQALQLVCASNFAFDKKGNLGATLKNIPHPGLIITAAVTLIIIVAIAPIITAPATGETQSPIQKFNVFLVNVTNQTLGPASQVDLLPNTVLPYIPLAAMLAIAAGVVGFTLFRYRGGM